MKLMVAGADFSAAGAAFLPERFPRSARIRVLVLASDRAELIETIAGIPAQIRWLELEQWPFEVRKNAEKHSWLNARYILGGVSQWRNQGSRPYTRNQMVEPMREPRVETG